MNGLVPGAFVAIALGVVVGVIEAVFSGLTGAAFLHGAALGASLPASVGLVFIALRLPKMLSGIQARGWEREIFWAAVGAIGVACTAWWLEGGLVRAAASVSNPNFATGVSLMEPIGLIATGGALFFGLAFAAAVFVSWLADGDRPIPATIAAIGSVLLISWLGDISPLQWVRDHPALATAAIPAYLAVAAGWGYIKWGLHIDAVGRKVDAAKVSFAERLADAASAGDRELADARSSLTRIEGAGRYPDAAQADVYGRRDQPGHREVEGAKETVARLERDRWWEVEARREAEWNRHLMSAGVTCRLPLRVSENKARIISWMAYWPASMAWTVLDDPFRRAMVAIFERIGGSLQRMSDRRFQGMDDAWKLPPGGR